MLVRGPPSSHLLAILKYQQDELWQPVLLQTPCATKCYDCSYLLILSGDIEPNPGPRRVYPCGICDKLVRYGKNVKALLCDGCNQWHHVKCLDMNSVIDEALEHDIEGSWTCCRCGMPNFSTTLFDSSAVSDVSSPSSVNLSSPLAASSPIQQRQRPRGNQRSPTNRVVVINCQSAKSKKPEIESLIDTPCPSIIIATETHLDPSVNSAEIFLSNLQERS